MLTLVVPKTDWFNEASSTFESVDGFELELEHSLVSLSKWESRFRKPFLSPNEKTSEETVAYIEAMILTPTYPEFWFNVLTKEHLDAINEYIESSESATTFGDMPKMRSRGEVITSELIYYWMVAFTIPFECERWHLNRLFALIRICNIKNSKQKKMSRGEIARRNRDLNEQRKAMYHTTG